MHEQSLQELHACQHDHEWFSAVMLARSCTFQEYPWHLLQPASSIQAYNKWESLATRAPYSFQALLVLASKFQFSLPTQ